MDQALEAFLNANWEDILPRLTKFAVKHVRHYSWSTQGALPKGLEVEDLVISAVEKTLNGLKCDGSGKGIRKWDPEACPQLIEFLMGVVRSEISALAKSHDHQQTDRESKHTQLDEMPDPKTVYDANDAQDSRYEELITSLRPMIAGDSEVEQVMIAIGELIGAEEEPSSTAIMDLTGFSSAQVRNAKRRLQTLVDKVLASKGGR